MTTKLSDYGVSGTWIIGDCETCGKRRSCLVHPYAEPDGTPDTFLQCLLCIVADIDTMERHRRELGV